MKHLHKNTKENTILKYLFPFLCAGSFIWFLIRVIPKPSRAAYPCMRAAAPFASTFVLWVLGLCSSLIFLKKARFHFLRTHYLTATVCIITGAIIGGILLTSDFSTQAAPKANVPIGTASGVNPGRVVWVYDSSATPWQGPGSGHWWESKNTDQAVVDQMVSASLQNLSGKSTNKEAWDTLIRYYNRTHGRTDTGYIKGEKIAIKINLTFCNYFPEYCCVDSMTYHLNKKLDYMSTSPQVVRAYLRQLVNVVGVDQGDISIGDPVAYYPHEYYDSCHDEFPNVNYIDHAGKFGRTKVEYSDVPFYWSCRPEEVKQDYIPRHYVEATYQINIGNMKSHMGAGITVCAKNHYGSLRLPTEEGYYDLHKSLAFMNPQEGSYRALVDIMGQANLGGKTLLYIVDGLYAGNHNNDTVPHKWPVAPFNGGWTSSIFSSQDPVAIECVLLDLFQLDTDSFKYPEIAGAQDYLVEAAQADNPPSGTFYDPDNATPTKRLKSLGVFEHWNNSIERRYSRNLGSGNGIELLFHNDASSIIHLKNQPSRKQYSNIRMIPNSQTIEFSIPYNCQAVLALSDVKGRNLGTIFDKKLISGIHRFDLHNTFFKNHAPASGTYLFLLYKKDNGSMYKLGSCTAVFSK